MRGGIDNGQGSTWYRVKHLTNENGCADVILEADSDLPPDLHTLNRAERRKRHAEWRKRQ
jgi:hypothetical protein